MVRAAAKNHAYVGVVVDPADYEPVLDELGATGRPQPTSRADAWPARPFATTTAYDAEIVAWLDRGEPGLGLRGAPAPTSSSCRPALELTLERRQVLRYGENPHQVGARYRADGRSGWWDTAVQHGGKEMSYLNVYDTEAAWRLVHSLGEGPAAVVIKHANPCGVALAERHLGGLRARPRLRSGFGLRGDRGGEPAGHRGHGRGAGPGVHRGAGGSRLRGRRPGAPAREAEPAHPRGPAPRARRAQPPGDRRWLPGADPRRGHGRSRPRGRS